jgi:hypothetical protein
LVTGNYETDLMIASYAGPPGSWPCSWTIKWVGGAKMTEIDLVDWTIQEAQHLKAERRKPGEVNDASLDKLLGSLEREPAGRTNPEGPAVMIAGPPTIYLAVDEPITRPSSEAFAATKPATGPDLPTIASAVSSISAEALTAEPKSALLKAIVEPDIYTARAERDRAVVLRWVLRDIKNNRLKWWPVNENDLRNLIEMGLVELRNDAPVLTNAGVSAIT